MVHDCTQLQNFPINGTSPLSLSFNINRICTYRIFKKLLYHKDSTLLLFSLFRNIINTFHGKFPKFGLMTITKITSNNNYILTRTIFSCCLLLQPYRLLPLNFPPPRRITHQKKNNGTIKSSSVTK